MKDMPPGNQPAGLSVASMDRVTSNILPKRIAVIGGGAIGGIIAAAAGEAGHAVTLCVRTPIKSIVIERDGIAKIAHVGIAVDPVTQTVADWVFIATKTQDTASAAPWLGRLIGPQTVVVLLQNGVDGVDIARPFVGTALLLPSIIYIAAERTAPGRVVHHFGNRIEVPQGDTATALAALLGQGGIEVMPQADFTTAAWRKLICNIAVNPITALTMQRFSVFSAPQIRDLADGLMREAISVGNAAGAHFLPAAIDEIIAYSFRLSPQSGTSMLYDRLAGNRLEFEHLTGTIVRLAKKYNIAAPLNNAIYALLAALDKSSMKSPRTAAISQAANDRIVNSSHLLP
jgi:2-dehydropantoate 2-reductase